jgi:acyl-coenzyme A thioesterase PaaI-like protein
MLGAMKDFDVTRMQSIWAKMAPLPMGKQLFSRAAGLVAPYTATIGAQVVEFEPGYARVSMADRRAVRNHLRCVHAVALVNLAELTGNLALIAAMPSDARMIVKGLSIEYLKKGPQCPLLQS